MRDTWEASFAEQVASQAYNTAPVEALVRSISYYLRDIRPEGDYEGLHFAEMGCGAGPNLVWLAEKGITASGVDISPTALGLARHNLEAHQLGALTGRLIERSVTAVPEIEDESLDGVIESCVFQHLNREDRTAAFSEVARVLKPGGLFVGHMLERGHTVYGRRSSEELGEDPGTLQLDEGGSRFYLTNIGLSHFFSADEISELFADWSSVDPCLLQYELPSAEARKRGYEHYRQSMLVVHAIK